MPDTHTLRRPFLGAQDTLSAAKAAIAELEGSTEALQSRAAVGQELNSATNRVLVDLTEQTEALRLERARLEAELAARQAEVEALAASSAAVSAGELSLQEEANEEAFRSQEQLAALRAELDFAAAREGALRADVAIARAELERAAKTRDEALAAAGRGGAEAEQRLVEAQRSLVR